MLLERPPAELKLIRHAESQRNVALRGLIHYRDEAHRATLGGIPDHQIALTERGVDQALQTGRALAQTENRAPHVIIHSGYERAKLTAELIVQGYPEAARNDIKIVMCDLIRERDPGYGYDMTTDEALQSFPYLLGHWQTYGGFLSRPPGGESLADAAVRVRLFLELELPKYSGQVVYVVTHGGTLRCFRFLLENLTYDQVRSWSNVPEGHPDNCGINTYSWTADGEIFRQRHNEVLWKGPNP